MTLLLDRTQIAARRAAAAGPLAPLARSLAAELRVAIEQVAPDGEPFLPAEKARMTRRGGRCPREGALLAFDPFEPRRHLCSACGAMYEGEEHYRWWVMWYQLWLAERAVRAAVLYLLRGDTQLGEFAARVLDAYAERYLGYPNVDNVLGPTRLFFSTYLESIWLLQLCVAVDALEAADLARHSALGARVRERAIEPSRALIAGYDERRSNRQVWNGAALQAAARVLDDRPAVGRLLDGPSGLLAQLSHALLADGTWYEGENYHQFAHRGLWYAITLAEGAGAAIPRPLVARFEEGFAAPFLSALPDFTLPSRRDSQYAISLRQWRYAESCELGLARRDDERLAGSLVRIYDAAYRPRRDTGRWRSAAESERNEPPTSLSRADLGWRALLHARAELPDVGAWSPGSVLLPAQGLAVLRRDGGRVYTALDYGNSGGGHGHPDRLNVLLSDGDRRWLDDMGTGSYVERTLHWYRSTLAHNAPLVDGRSQTRVDGRLLAWADDGSLGWVRAEARIAPAVTVRRTLVVGDYLVDRVEWTAARDVALDLPLHVDVLPAEAGPWRATSLEGAGGLEDGFDFLEQVEAAEAATSGVVALVDGERRAVAYAHVEGAATWYRAIAPGPPGRRPVRFLFVRARAATGRITVVWDPRAAIDAVAGAADAVVVTRRDGGVDEHRPVGDRWQVTSTRGGRRQRPVVLSGVADTPAAEPRAVDDLEPPRVGVTLTDGGSPWIAELGGAHYRRSEPTWEEAGSPVARVCLQARDGRLEIRVDVRQPQPRFVSAGVENELDNERAEVNGDGVQLHVRPAPIVERREPLAWLLVPDEGEGDRVRATPTTHAAASVALAATWRWIDGGWRVDCALPLDALGPPGAPFLLDVVVNETAAGRERRRGQLVLSGGAGEFVYLQGDRHEPRVLVAVAAAPSSRG